MTTMTTKAKALLVFDRVFTKAGEAAYDAIDWESRNCEIRDASGELVFSQHNVEVPSFWSQTATNVVASKYFYGKAGTSERESSVRQLVDRVANTITDWGAAHNYFDEDNAEVFREELKALLVNQYGAFNSPVWFNCGLFQYHNIKGGTKGGYYYDLDTKDVKRATNHYEYPQCSACFIQSVSDDMEDLMGLAANEARLFKYGSGTGTDLSTIRSYREDLSGGGQPSGPMSFLRIYDNVAGIVKSGGKTRRAAKMNTLKDWHPDVMEFVQAKTKEEKKAHALIDAGYDGSFNGEAYGSVAFQNENLSLRVSDAFMKAEHAGDDWTTRWVTDPNQNGPTYPARDILKEVAKGTHFCGDPGLQYEDTIQRWHTCKADGPINSSNPCSEYMFLDNTACNLASINLMKFRNEDGTFDHERFLAAVRVFTTAQEIVVNMSAYPTEDIAKNSHLYRTLGLGYANLGAYLMSLGLAYDSDAGRAQAAAFTALMHMGAYEQSAKIAEAVGAFERYEANKDSMLEVLRLHEEHVVGIDETHVDAGLMQAVRAVSRNAVELGEKHGYRNAQVTVLAPTGTISFLMDCDTTGVEPDIALVKYKLLASTDKDKEGGMLKMVNRTVPLALSRLGYSDEERVAILKHIDETDTIEGAPHIKDEHLAVFDCAFKAANGERYISYHAHIRMMAAVQPFLSGAISKTVNVPEDATVSDIIQVYRDGWDWGLKAVAVYRENSKRSQPLNTSKAAVSDEEVDTNHPMPTQTRERMPNVRQSLTHKFSIGAHEGYMNLGYYPDGRIGEIFVTMAKEGSTIRGLMDCWSTAVSIGLQHGVPLETFMDKFMHTRFEPAGWCNGGSPIKSCSSLPDYIFRWIAEHLEGTEEAQAVSVAQPVVKAVDTGAIASKVMSDANKALSDDAPPCDNCGAITVRNGTCFKCNNCGNSLGCS